MLMMCPDVLSSIIYHLVVDVQVAKRFGDAFDFEASLVGLQVIAMLS